jgi:hypothetical protein
MFGRRLLILVAVLMGLTALAASLAPPPPEGGRGQPGASPSPAPPAAATPVPGDGGGTVTASISASGSAIPRKVTAVRGDLVDLTVSGDVIDTVSIARLGVLEPMDPGSPALVQLYADTPGRFPIRLLDAGRQIGTLLISG